MMAEGKLKIAVVGVGHLGKEHARVYSQLPNVELVGVVDIDEEQGRAVAKRLGTNFYSSVEELDGKASAVSVVVPTRATCNAGETHGRRPERGDGLG